MRTVGNIHETIRLAVSGKSPGHDGEVRVDCPFHGCAGGQRNTLGVNVTTGAYHCFRCDVSGNYLKVNNFERKSMPEFLFEKARLVSTHPYTERKNIKPSEIRQDDHGNWVVPFTNRDGRIQTVQFITTESKRFLSKDKNSGVGFKGSAYIIEGAKDIVIWCEGAATGWSLHHATGATVYCCGGKSNLDSVIEWSAGRYPGSRKIIAGDNDQSGDGQKVAAAAARKHGFMLAIPETVGDDFNDVDAKSGLDAVKAAIKEAKPSGHDAGSKIKETGFSAADLQKMDFPEIKWAVPGILPEGLNILAGKPKKGKSILAVNLAVAVASGGKAFGEIPVEQGSVICLALEDTGRRLKARLKMMMPDGVWPEKLHFFPSGGFNRMGEGGITDLEAEIKRAGDTRLVIIDTLAKFRPPSTGKRNQYELDYENIARLKDLSDRYGLTVLVIHHQRKAESEDVFDTFSGTLGLTGAADGMLALVRRGDDGVLSVTGRDVDESEYAIKLNTEVLTWEWMGEAAFVQSTQQRQTLFDAFMNHPDDTFSPKELSEMTDLKIKYVKKTLPTMLLNGDIRKVDRGKYQFRGDYRVFGDQGDLGDYGDFPEKDSEKVPMDQKGDFGGDFVLSNKNNKLSTKVPKVPKDPMEELPDICQECTSYQPRMGKHYCIEPADHDSMMKSDTPCDQARTMCRGPYKG